MFHIPPQSASASHTPIPQRRAAAPRPRTISEPPAPYHDVNRNATHAPRQFHYTGLNGTGSLSSMRKSPRSNLSQGWTQAERDLSSQVSHISGREVISLEDNFDLQSFHGTYRSSNLSLTSRKNSSIHEKDELSNADDHMNVRFEAAIKPSANFLALEKKLRDIFRPFRQSGNAQEIDGIIESRCEELVRLKVDVNELDRMLQNAERIDNATAIIFGGGSALGFIGGGQAWTALKPILEKQLPANFLPYVPGGITGIVDRVLSSFLSDMHVGYYTKGGQAALEPAMQQWVEQHRPSFAKEQARQAGALCAPYTTRNVVRSIAAPVAAHAGRTAFVDTLIDGLGGIPSGALVQTLRNAEERSAKQMGPAILLAREDWSASLEELRHGPFSPQRIKQLAIRGWNGSSQAPRMIFNAGVRLFTLESMTEIGLLMGGFACNEWAKEFVHDQYEDASPEASAFVTSATGTVSLAILYSTLSVAMGTASWLRQKCAVNTASSNEASGATVQEIHDPYASGTNR